MIKTLLVDDEYLALNLLENFLTQLGPEWQVLAKMKSPTSALEYLSEEPVDVLFLDIQMPGLLGTDLLKALQPNPPITIFTTAYTDFAPMAFDLNAVDYLLKPFSYERLAQACEKAKAQLRFRIATENINQELLSIKVDGQYRKLPLDTILYIEGLKEYVRIVCKNGQKYVILESLQYLERTLPADRFMRVHKSYIVAMNAVTALDGYKLALEDTEIPISRSKKEEIKLRLFQ